MMKITNHKPFAIQRIKTKDLWQSAFLLAKGSHLQDLCVKTDGHRQEVTFILSGENINRLKREFTSGQAVCRVGILKASMMHLKDEMFRVIRTTSVN